METIIVVPIYLIGCVCAYLIAKSLWKRDFNEWKVSARNSTLLASLGSWLFFIMVLVLYITKPRERDEDAKW